MKEVLYRGRIIKVTDDRKFIREYNCNCGDTCFCQCCGEWKHIYKTESGEEIERGECSDLLDKEPNQTND
jgi:hypothetical protein